MQYPVRLGGIACCIDIDKDFKLKLGWAETYLFISEHLVFRKIEIFIQ